MLSCERATENVITWYNFQSHFTGSIHPTLCIYISIYSTEFCKMVSIHIRRYLHLHLMVLKDLEGMIFLMTTENWKTSYLSMKPENKHKINVVCLDTVPESWSLIIIQPGTHFHFICTSISGVDLNAVFFLFCEGFFFLQEQQKEALVCMGIRIHTLCLSCRRRKERFSNRGCS